MIKRRKIELEESNSILDIITDEKGKILFVKREDITGEISTVRGYGKLISKADIKFSNLKMPVPRKGYKVVFQYEYNRNDPDKSRLGYITIFDIKGNIYSQEHLLSYSSLIVIEEGKRIINGDIPTICNRGNNTLSDMIGTNIKSIDRFLNRKKSVNTRQRKLKKTRIL